MTTHYHERAYLVPAAYEESFAAELWARGALGCEIRDASNGRVRLIGFFPEPPPAALATWDLGEWPRRGVEAVGAAAVADRDWLAEYRATARAIPVGRTFVVSPRDPDDPAETLGEASGAEGRTLLRIPARTAFGTGSHESTRLAAEWLEEIEIDGREVLDVGTGSGILAFMALVRGARRVVAFDLDAQAALLARANAELNGLAPAIFAGRLAALRPAPAFDVALVNVLPELVLGELPQLYALLRPGGRLISSGNLWERRGELRERFAASGLVPVGEKREGEWVAFLFER